MNRLTKIQDINIGVKIIPADTNVYTLQAPTKLLLRDITTDINGGVYIASESIARSKEILHYITSIVNAQITHTEKIDGYDVETKTNPNVTYGRINTLIEDIDITTSHNTVVMYPPINLSKETGFRTVKQLMAQYNYTEAAPVYIRGVITKTPKVIILITSLSFLTCVDDNYISLRKEFLSKYEIVKINIHNDCMDNTNTLITVIAKLHCDNTTVKHDNVKCVVYPLMGTFNVNLDNPLATVAYEYHEFVNYKSKYITFSRYVENNTIQRASSNMLPTNLYLNSVDSARMPISMEIRPPTLGKTTDRSGCTIVSSVKIMSFVDTMLCEKFNSFINQMRDKYHSIFLINFRGVGVVGDNDTSPRKRIPYNAVYAILSRFCDEIIFKGVIGNIPKLIQERDNRDPQFKRLMQMTELSSTDKYKEHDNK